MSRTAFISAFISVCLTAVVTAGVHPQPVVDYPKTYSPGSGLFVTLNQTWNSGQNNSFYTLVGLTNFRTHELYLHNETQVLPSQHWQQLHALFFNAFDRTIAFRRDTGNVNGTYKVELIFFEYGPDRAPFSSRRFPSCVVHGPYGGHELRPFVLNGVAYVMDSRTGVVSFLLNSHRHENSTCQLSPTPATTFCAYPTTFGGNQWTVSSPTTLSFILGWGNAFDPMLVNVKATGARGLSSSCYSAPPSIFPPVGVEQCGSALAVDTVKGVYYFLSCAEDAPGSPPQLQTTLYEGTLHAMGGYNSTWRSNLYWANLTYREYGTLVLDARNATEYGGPLFCAGSDDSYGLTCFTKYWQDMWNNNRAGPAFGTLVGYDPLCA